MTTTPGTRQLLFDVTIVGAGPAGLAAAEVLRGYDLKVALIDEQPRAGGQILRQPPDTFRVANWLSSPLYDRVKGVLRSVENAPNVSWFFSATVLGVIPKSSGTSLAPEFELVVQTEDGCTILRSQTVLLAPGCYEVPLPFPGWTLPGVMGVGAIQAFIKSQQLVPGKNFLLCGSHPLQLVVADQLVSAGAKVAAVVFTQRLAVVRSVLRSFALLSNLPPLLETTRIMLRLKRADVHVRFGTTITRVEGDTEVQRASLSPIEHGGSIDANKSEYIQCDRVGLCYGFGASSELARHAGAVVTYGPQNGGWLAAHDPWFETTVERLFVAGEITGLAGADASLDKGRIAAHGILRALQKMSDTDADDQVLPTRRRLKRTENFAARLNELSLPPAALAKSVISDDTIVCRCESVTLQDLRNALAQHEYICSINGAKLVTRAGMGMCQGRLCGDSVARILAESRGLSPADVGTFRTQFPVKPLNLSLLKGCNGD